MDKATTLFEAERPRLIALCYRMLGERAAAEDAVQDCWIRWAGAGQVDNPQAWLTRVATRIALDMLRSAQARRERYVGPWLPEPLVVSDDNPAEAAFAQAQECSLALLWAMERLEPAERAALILREAMECDYAQIAETLGKSQAACRQLVSRARRRLPEAGAPLAPVVPAQAAELLTRFLAAVQAGDAGALRALLTPEALSITDGGAKARAARRPLVGPEEIATVTLAVAAQLGTVMLTPCTANGAPALLLRRNGAVDSVLALTAAPDGRIGWLYTLRAPEKLAHLT